MAAVVETTRDRSSERCHTPPGVQGTPHFDSAAPTIHGGSFSFMLHPMTQPTVGQRVLRRGNSAYTDSLFREYPTDPMTDLPYPLLLPDDNGRHAARVDYHHLFHPRAMLESSTEPSDRALRVCFGQDVPRWLHEKYHQKYDGPGLPVTVQDKFAVVVLACAGVVPRKAMQLVGDDFTLATPTADQYEVIRASIHYEYKSKELSNAVHRTRRKLGQFFALYALEQNVRELMNDSIIDCFLSARSAKQRQNAGNQILTAAIRSAVEPIRPKYVEAFHEMGVSDQKPKWIGTVINSYFFPNRRQEYFHELQKRLVA